jgi:hypothetical protein
MTCSKEELKEEIEYFTKLVCDKSESNSEYLMFWRLLDRSINILKYVNEHN